MIFAHRCELAENGDFVNLNGIVAYNCHGTVIVWDGLCPHRGTRLFDDLVGNRPLICPYHGWKEHAIAGRVRQIPHFWLDDWLFITNGDELDNNLINVVGGISKSIRHCHSLNESLIACDWRVAVENTLEDAHVSHVHANTFSQLKITCTDMERYGNNSIAYYKIGNERTVKMLRDMLPLFDQGEPEHYFHLFLYPYVCLSSVGGFTYSLQHYFPCGTATRFVTRLYTPPICRGGERRAAFLFNEARSFNEQVFREDIVICERVSGRGHSLMDSERRIAWFREADGSA